MFAYLPHRRLTLPLAPTLGGALGLAVALTVVLMPGEMLARIVMASRIASVLPPAAPPLGGTARALLVLAGGGGVALVGILALQLAIGTRRLTLGARPARDAQAVPVLRRADAHPDAPARQPVLAHRDLGVPLLDVPIEAEEERSLPDDLGQTLAAYDPDAIPETPREPVPAVAPLARFVRPQIIDPGDRLETFALPRPCEVPMAGDEPGVSLHSLLDRLERGVTRRDRRPPAPVRPAPAAADGLQEALGTLRRLAAGA